MATYQNGKIPISLMRKVGCFLPIFGAPAAGQYLQAEAQRQVTAFQNAFFLKFHKPMYISEGYRDYANQVFRRNLYIRAGGNLAAVPGTSVHGWALAVDFGSGIATPGSPEKKWADANGPKYGWLPIGNSFGEAWHFEYRGGATLIAPANIKIITKIPVITKPAAVTSKPISNSTPTHHSVGNNTDMFAIQLAAAATGKYANTLPKGAQFILDTREKTLTRVDNHGGASPAQLQTLKDEFGTYAFVQPEGKPLVWSGNTAWRYVDGGYTRKGW